MTFLPTINLQRLALSADGRTTALDDLRLTLGTTGAFYLVGHGIEPEAADRLFASSRRFFALPEPERRSIEMVNSPHFRGYTALGNEYTQVALTGAKSSTSVSNCPRRAAPGGPPYWRLQGPNQWPAALPELRPAVLDWLERLRAVAVQLAKAIAGSLGPARNYFDDAFLPDPHLLSVRPPRRRRRTPDEGGFGAAETRRAARSAVLCICGPRRAQSASGAAEGSARRCPHVTRFVHPFPRTAQELARCQRTRGLGATRAAPVDSCITPARFTLAPCFTVPSRA
jgi:hypothetical protein